MAGDRTMFFLLAEFGAGHIPVTECCKYFSLSEKEANRAAACHRLPVPAFRMGSQKSPWLVSAEHLAQYIDDKKKAAKADWERVHAA